MRYVHNDFPKVDQLLIEELNYVSHFEELPEKILKVEKAFNEAVSKVKSRKSL